MWAGLLGYLMTCLCTAEVAAAAIMDSKQKDPLGTTAALPLGATPPLLSPDAISPANAAAMPAGNAATAVLPASAQTGNQVLPEMQFANSPAPDRSRLAFHSAASVHGASAEGAAAAVQAAADALRATNARMAVQQTQMPLNTQAAAASETFASQDPGILQKQATQSPVSAHAFGSSIANSPDSIPNLATSFGATANYASSAATPGVLDPNALANAGADVFPRAGVRALYANMPTKDSAPAAATALSANTQFPTAMTGASSSQPTGDRASGRLLRREAAPRNSASSGYISDEATIGSERFEGTERFKDKEYKEDPSWTPETIFKNKKLAPDIMEFLGHLAKNREYRHSGGKPHSTHDHNGVLAEGNHEKGDEKGEDDSDDAEDRMMLSKRGTPSTAISMFLEKIDSKSDAASWTTGDCAALAHNISTSYGAMSGRTSLGSWGLAGPATARFRSTIHTGIFLQHWNIGNMKQAVRKLRLGILSFLATQDALKLNLHIWTDMDRHSDVMLNILGPLNSHPEMLDAINITTFDPQHEFAKVPPSVARERLHERYEQDAMPMLRPDLYRAVILYNYGGIWMDADTILMQDVVPLMGEDWAYIARGKEGAVEGALLSSSRPRSHFANEYLMNMIMKDEPLFSNTAEEKPILVELFESDPDHANFHVLPPCFVDAEPSQSVDAAVLAADVVPETQFFGRSVPSSYREYFLLGIEDAEQEAANSTDASGTTKGAAVALELPDEKFGTHSIASPSWAYHWRGNWNAPWKQGSFADVAERTFTKKLRLPRSPKYFS